MNEIKIFENSEFGAVRTVTIDDVPYFVGKDVADILGYEAARNAIAAHVDSDDKLTHQISASGQMRNVTLINESGLYCLILSSKLPNAKKFKKWVTSEVLPSIRKYGLYAVEDLIENPDLMIAAAMALKEHREKSKNLKEKIAVQNQQIAELQPKASYYDVVLNCKDLVSISTIAKDYGWSAKRMNNYLHESGIQFKQGGIWLLYQKYAECGYTSTKTHTVNVTKGDVHSKIHTYWTQQGRLFIYDLMKKNGFLPNIEK